MIQEYLFTTEKYKIEIERFSVPEKIRKEIRTIENSSCWILCLSIDSESIDAAKILDPLNTQICESYKPTILSNECSAYFNKSLFPIVNEFERKLRKLLYLASALQDDNEAHNVIVNLESKDLGTIFTALFSDSNFISCVKEKVKNISWKFTRNEILALIKTIEEKTLWDTLLGGDCVKTLRERFGELKDYRNDVMHAHNIDLNQYQSAKRLFHKVNEELDVAIGKLIGAKEENKSVASSDFNNTLGFALASMQEQVDTSRLFDITEKLKKMSTSYPVVQSEVAKSLSEIGKLPISEHILKPEFREVIANLGELSVLNNNILSATNAMRDAVGQMAIYNIEIPTAITKLQRILSEKVTELLPEDNNPAEKDEGDNSNG